jgi:uncharacterized membrane protein YsdA (DUF1294 family)
MIVWIYIAVINIIGFLSMGIDKAKAKKGAWRVPEKTLFLFPLLGGGLGSWIGMYFFRHKTKHWYFVVGIPAIFIIELGIAVYILMKYNIL